MQVLYTSEGPVKLDSMRQNSPIMIFIMGVEVPWNCMLQTLWQSLDAEFNSNIIACLHDYDHVKVFWILLD